MLNGQPYCLYFNDTFESKNYFSDASDLKYTDNFIFILGAWNWALMGQKEVA